MDHRAGAVMRWGIAGTGGVANAFAEALRDVPDAELVAVGSRSQEKALQFTEQHGLAPEPWGSYEALMADPNVDAVYVASPASHHYRHALLALQAGKHVLVEKPFTVNAAQALRLMNEAHDRELFLMEAMWPRFLPAYVELRRLLAGDAIGKVRAVQASFGGRATVNPRTRPFRLDLAGGALMDAAVYPISFAQMVGSPNMTAVASVAAVAEVGETGVDEQVCVQFGIGGVLASAFGGLTTTFDAKATIYGTEGMGVLPGNFTNPAYLDVLYPGLAPLHVDFAPERHRLAWQVDEVHACVATGALESRVMPLVATYEVMRILDAARAQIGLAFPDDVEAL